MSEYKIGLLFPANGIEAAGNEKEILFSAISSDVESRINNSAFLKSLGFVFKENNSYLFESELNSQLATYIYSAVFSDYLKKSGVVSSCLAGYSLGIYAALYHGGAVSFDDGLKIMHFIFKQTEASLSGFEFAMAGIIGFDTGFLTELLNSGFKSLKIINKNNKHSHVVSGYKDEIIRFLDTARSEGALSSKLLPVTAPYHTDFMREPSLKLLDFLKTLTIQNSEINIISGIDQRIFREKNEIIKELADNLIKSISWNNVMENLLKMNMNIFIESGPGNSLYKISRFIPGDYQFYTMKTIDKFYGLS